ncbi:MAG: ABC transporter ATP-binding protein [Gammaproteobacteria bacterium]|jgi:peptide/nickel transport system ATP-binding protein|nr:ABC transporter ATP-binding protein [Gammaproteobacteria bacterium]
MSAETTVKTDAGPVWLLEVAGLSTRFGAGPRAIVPVSNLSFRIRTGEVFALVGESGCGKSMTALSLMRLLPDSGRITAGRVALGGRELLTLPESAMRSVRGGEMGMIFQEPMTSLNPVLTVGRQVMEACVAHGHARGGDALRQAEELLHKVGIPDTARRAGEYPHQLSGGLKQRVMIAMALAGRPGLLVADEPTTALDVTIQTQVLDLLNSLRRDTGMGILLITHDLGVVAEIADRVAVMYAGEIVETCSVRALFDSPAHPYTRLLFRALPDRARRGGNLVGIAGSPPSLSDPGKGCRFAPRCPDAMTACSREAPQGHDLAGDHRVRCHLYSLGARIPGDERQGRLAVHSAGVERPITGEPLLEVRDLEVHFPVRRGLFHRVVGHVRAVDGVSLAVHAGRTLALVGESGCGKTTLGKGILRLIEPSGGSVRFQGSDLTRLGRRDLRSYRGALQIIFQDPYASLNPRMLVGDILEEGMIALGVEGDREARRERVDLLLKQVGLEASARDRYPHEFSGGQRQRIGIARALTVSPRLLVSDEPTSALDVSVQAQILNLLRELQQSLDIAYLFITHDISVVAYMADEIAVMYLGRIVEQGTTGEILTRPLHPYTQSLLASVPRSRPDLEPQRVRLQGDPPSPADPPSGCAFHPRCPWCEPRCIREFPPQSRAGDRHIVRCFRATAVP